MKHEDWIDSTETIIGAGDGITDEGYRDSKRPTFGG